MVISMRLASWTTCAFGWVKIFVGAMPSGKLKTAVRFFTGASHSGPQNCLKICVQSTPASTTFFARYLTCNVYSFPSGSISLLEL